MVLFPSPFWSEANACFQSIALWTLLHGVNDPEVLSKCTAAAQAPEALLDPLTTFRVTNFWL